MRRRWIFWILVIIFVWVVISRYSEIKKLAETLMTGQWQWVAAAFLSCLIYYIVYTALYQSAFLTVGVQSKLIELLPITFSSIFMKCSSDRGARIFIRG
jgi:uncharacterized membrane protein YbhN (UPF0104 family)